MKVCFVVSQIFAWGKYGGFGSLTRTLGRGLVQRGLEVCAVVPLRGRQQSRETLDGITILGFSRHNLLSSIKLYQQCNADIYHSEEPSMGTWLAQQAMPSRRHMVTSQDPRTGHDWLIEYAYFSPYQKLVSPAMYLYEKNPFIKRAVKGADAVYCQAKYIAPKSQALYGLSRLPEFLPNPVSLPDRTMAKAQEPTVCFLARWDRRKRPEIFFKLAKQFNNVKFIAIGKAHEARYDQYLRETYGGIPNIELAGFIDQFSSDAISRILERSWVMVNTAARECLPVAFLEAAAHQCAILSGNNPDNFADAFGHHVHNDDYETGLRFLLEENRWRDRGQKGYAYVKATHEMNKVINQHLDVYTTLCRKS